MKKTAYGMLLCLVMLVPVAAEAQSNPTVNKVLKRASDLFHARICEFVNGQSLCVWDQQWVRIVDFNEDGLLDFVVQIPPAPFEIVGTFEDGSVARARMHNYPPPQTRVYCTLRKETDIKECYRGPYAHISFQRAISSGYPTRGAVKMVQYVIKDECTAEVTEYQWDKDEFFFSSKYEMTSLTDSCIGPYAAPDTSGAASTPSEGRPCSPADDQECGC